MLQEFNSTVRTDNEGNVAGGDSFATGVMIRWQDEPLGRGDGRRTPNGAFVETVIALAKGRLEQYQCGRFACEENERAIIALADALLALSKRTSRREAAGVEGTNVGS